MSPSIWNLRRLGVRPDRDSSMGLVTLAGDDQPVGTGYYALTTAGIVAALAILVGTFPLLARITGPEVARNE